MENKQLYENIALRIRFERLTRNLTQEKLAELSELSYHTINIIESGKNNSTLETLNSVANAFGIPIQELFNFDFDKNELMSLIKK